jgi:hypothetical protein
VVAINAGVLVTAAVLVAVSPATVSPSLPLAEALVLAVGTALMISVNLLLMRRVFGSRRSPIATSSRPAVPPCAVSRSCTR